MRYKFIFPLILSLFVVFFFLLQKEHSLNSVIEEESTINTFGSFHTETISSFDDQIRLEIDDRNPMIKIYVIDQKSNAIVYSFEPVRKWDFWGVCFENDNYNIWIQSGDIGIICYEYCDGKWQYNSSAVKPSYIISK